MARPGWSTTGTVPDSHALALASEMDLVVDPELGIGDRTSTVTVTLTRREQLTERVPLSERRTPEPDSPPMASTQVRGPGILGAVGGGGGRLYDSLQRRDELQRLGPLLAACSGASSPARIRPAAEIVGRRSCAADHKVSTKLTSDVLHNGVKACRYDEVRSTNRRCLGRLGQGGANCRLMSREGQEAGWSTRWESHWRVVGIPPLGR